MRAAKTHFEQIPVETVKKIAVDLPPADEAGNDSVGDETQDGTTSPSEHWRALAQQVQQEKDPTKMVELAEQLLAELDKEELRKRSRWAGTQGL